MESAEQRVVACLAGIPEVERVWLFGSRARGDARPRSDIDLAIEAPRADARRWQDILDAVEEAPAVLRAEIERTGRLLHGG